MKLILLPLSGARISIALIVMLLFITASIYGQQINQPDTLIATESLRQDFVLFREALQKDHAGLYRYKSKFIIDRLFDSCFTALTHPMTTLEFSKSILYVISAVEDGHTGTNISKMLMTRYTDNEKLFPVPVYFIGQKVFVRCNISPELPAGTEIISIDNVATEAIKVKLFRYMPSDGRIESKKIQTLNNGAFPFLYRLIFGSAESFNMEYITKQGIHKSITVDAALLSTATCPAASGSAGTGNLQLDFLPGNIALLTIKTFDQGRMRALKFRDFLDTSFNEINARGTRKLIIDLRGNGGGNDEYGALLYSYLAKKPFPYFLSVESVTQKIKPGDNFLLGLQQPQPNRYKGEILFLINGLCFSTTADFCSIAKSNERGKFIGEETGGGYYGNTSGRFSNIELPVSKITIKIPRFNYVNAVKRATYPDRGIIPDYIISPGIDDVIAGKDVQLEFALQLVKKK